MNSNRGIGALMLVILGAMLLIGCPDEDYSTVVYMRNDAGNIWGDLYTMDYSGSNHARLTDSGADAHPRWSPDKDRIAFSRRIDGAGGDWDIYIINRDGTGEAVLVEGDADDVNPAWSPDGEKLAYQSNRSGTNEIWILNVSSGIETLLPLAGDVFPTYPTWSPGGDKIAFRGVGDPGIGGLSGIWVANYPAGDGLVLLAEGGFEPDWYMKSHTDGGKILYREHGDIKIMNGDGSDKRLVTQGEYPTWSVNFDEVIFQRAGGADFDIYRVYEGGTSLAQMTDDTDIDQRYPHW